MLCAVTVYCLSVTQFHCNNQWSCCHCGNDNNTTNAPRPLINQYHDYHKHTTSTSTPIPPSPLIPTPPPNERQTHPRLRVEHSRTRLVTLQCSNDPGVALLRSLSPSTLVLPSSIQRKGDEVRNAILNEMASFCKSRAPLCSTASSCVHEYEHYAQCARRIFLIVRNDGAVRRRRTTLHRPVSPSPSISISSWFSSRIGSPSSTRLGTLTGGGTRR